MNDPRRLIDDPDVPASIREAIAGERSSRGGLDPDGGWTKLRAAAVARGATAAATGAPAAALSPLPAEAPRAALGIGTSSWIRLGIGVSTLAVVGAVWGIAHPSSAPSSAAEPTSSVANARAAAEVARAPAADDGTIAAPSLPVSALPPAPASPPPAPRALTAAKPALDDSALREELAQLREIRARIDRDPAYALFLAEDGQRRFSTGHLVEEREGLGVIALARLGRHDDARAKAKSFIGRYPKSALVARIEAELAVMR